MGKMDIESECVIGAGIMGSGISQLLAIQGINVNLVDVSEDILVKVKNSIETNLQKFFVTKNKISQEEPKAKENSTKITIYN